MLEPFCVCTVIMGEQVAAATLNVEVEKTSFVAALVILKVVLVTESAGLVVLAFKVSPVPAVPTWQPAKVATPETGVTLNPLVGHVSVPLPVSASVTEAELLVTVLPFASSIVTTGWIGNAVLTSPPLGCVVKTN